MNSRDLPKLPASRDDESDKKNRGTITNNDDDDEFEFYHEFARENVKVIIHLITDELKTKGMDIEYLFIPFRKEQTNEKLLKFLNKLFPMAHGKKIGETKSIKKIVSNTDCFTLFQALKYIWCRLPNGEIIGWNSYLEFKAREKYLGYPQKAFLEIMPKCLTSSNHASIVYDFLDLIVTISSNSIVNKLSARKIAKMSAIWGFNNKHFPENIEQVNEDFKFPVYNDNSIQDGIKQWLPAANAMFHLLLSFLRSFLPSDDNTGKSNSNLPKNLKNLLLNNHYPPNIEKSTYSSSTILTIPVVTLNTNQFSRKAWELIERCNDILDFTNPDDFQVREDYALLKSLFRKKNNMEGISRKMSQESRRIMKAIQTKHSTFQAGWAKRTCLSDPANVLKEEIEITRIDIDDYFIWTWLSSISYEETAEKKRIFGRSLILEFEFDGFKKWVVFQECDINAISSKSTTAKKQEEEIENEESYTMDSDTSKDYDKFQEQNASKIPEVRNISNISATSNSSNGIYHTVISKDALNGGNHGKHNLHLIEQKISKWNPLNNLRKKSNGSSNDDSKKTNDNRKVSNEIISNNITTKTTPSGLAKQDVTVMETAKFNSKFKENNDYNQQPESYQNQDNYTSRKNNKPPPHHSDNKKTDRVISQYSLLNSSKYQLPELETDATGFKIDLPDIDDNDINLDDNYNYNQKPVDIGEKMYLGTDAQPSVSPVKDRNSNTIDELQDMVEDMINGDGDSNTNRNIDDLDVYNPAFAYSVQRQNETFESLTKFDKYKPSSKRDESEQSLQDNSLINTEIPNLEKQYDSQNGRGRPTNSQASIPGSASKESSGSPDREAYSQGSYQVSSRDSTSNTTSQSPIRKRSPVRNIAGQGYSQSPIRSAGYHGNLQPYAMQEQSQSPVNLQNNTSNISQNSNVISLNNQGNEMRAFDNNNYSSKSPSPGYPKQQQQGQYGIPGAIKLTSQNDRLSGDTRYINNGDPSSASPNMKPIIQNSQSPSNNQRNQHQNPLGNNNASSSFPQKQHYSQYHPQQQGPPQHYSGDNSQRGYPQQGLQQDLQKIPIPNGPPQGFPQHGSQHSPQQGHQQSFQQGLQKGLNPQATPHGYQQQGYSHRGPYQGPQKSPSPNAPQQGPQKNHIPNGLQQGYHQQGPAQGPPQGYPHGQQKSPNPQVMPQGYPQQGYPQQGYPQSGLQKSPTPQGPPHGYPQQSYPPQQGYSQQGFIPDNIPMSNGGRTKHMSMTPQAQNGEMPFNNFIPPAAGHPSKLHSANLNKTKGRKQLYNDIRSGNFGI
ncbi:hypothetical protein TPHA_0F02780 [Tetrapisispora phaffii CBS 4417]|uniref:Meiotically up-regulated protein Msb1/Mug8 domain-containing protein n=1 Tax=Tetrapisispora phaffii (strain ATCC 24235 / CBS 4417 / NBRC 1672 / NRRL Y-8282 / UCD 70-5) TaxID=1071381 RepID=G8BUH3_TETPH|nr:hypothetical protein TPHA_0F02780 [Tetrapisispora phaffii CBS 4417]CCE63759.1 hypothetical protein TPHA_0F02780 [Tetrapisispora phaffii CBS 4417]